MSRATCCGLRTAAPNSGDPTGIVRSTSAAPTPARLRFGPEQKLATDAIAYGMISPILKRPDSSAWAQAPEDRIVTRAFYLQFDLGFAARTHSRLKGPSSGRFDHDGSVFPGSLTIGCKPATLQSEAIGGLALELSVHTRNLDIMQLTIGSAKSPSRGEMEIGGLLANVR